jgi:hypothetical protein
MNFEEFKKFLLENKKGIIFGAVAALLIRGLLR